MGPVRRPDRDSSERTVLFPGAATAGVRSAPFGRPHSLPPGISRWTLAHTQLAGRPLSPCRRALNPPSIPGRYAGGLAFLTIARPGVSASGHLSHPLATAVMPAGKGRTRVDRGSLRVRGTGEGPLGPLFAVALSAVRRVSRGRAGQRRGSAPSGKQAPWACWRRLAGHPAD